MTQTEERPSHADLMRAIETVRVESEKARRQDDHAHARIDRGMEDLASRMRTLNSYLHGEPGRPGVLQDVSVIKTKIGVGVWIVGTVGGSLVVGVVGIILQLMRSTP